ncbi:glycoside hydrolase family 28 protein [Portibacter lacus]|uniref:Glycoside hydrolase n=1 Tax=Portibacter lacus TaxID=1099794 RepID=A0AA37SUC3_9BACT|nr:glycoside hydrolase family 28 protein [Portibacter lacus]GLR19824.1 glycoside hydrolase [Portibacter lacus]
MIRYFLSIFAFSLFLISCSTNVGSSFTVKDAQDKEALGWKEKDKILSRIIAPIIEGKQYNIVDFGAKNDTTFDSRAAILRAIEQCTNDGGGMILFPKGNYFSDGPLHLTSNIQLHIEEGATLFFGDNPEKYLPMVKVRWEGTVCWNYSPLIYAIDAKNIVLSGKGTIDGRGISWSKEWRALQKPDKNRLRQMGNDLVPEDQRIFGNGISEQFPDYNDSTEHFLRPTLIEFYQCENILMEDLTLKNSPFWTVHPVFSKNITIRRLNIKGGYLNDDGIDPDSCEDVLIDDCKIETVDDAISIKAGRDQDAWERPGSKNIIVQNCLLKSGVNSFCIGSEMSGGVENVFIENCTIAGGTHALNFKCNLDRGGQVQNIYFRNIEVGEIEESLFIFRMDYHGYRGNNYPTKFNNFYVSDITCKGVANSPFKIIGIEGQDIERIYLNNITIEQAGDQSQFEHTSDILMSNVKVNGEKIKAPAN